MNKKNSCKFSLFIGILLLGFNSTLFAFENNKSNSTKIAIPTIANAQVFANFTDELPAVVNYFTNASEKEIIDFYQQHYSESLSQERKRGRLTLTYQQNTHDVRVVISQQNKKRQVDVIVEHTDK